MPKTVLRQGGIGNDGMVIFTLAPSFSALIGVGLIRQGLTGTMEHPSSDDSIHGFLSSGTRVGVLELERLVRAKDIGGRLLQAQL